MIKFLTKEEVCELQTTDAIVAKTKEQIKGMTLNELVALSELITTLRDTEKDYTLIFYYTDVREAIGEYLNELFKNTNMKFELRWR